MSARGSETITITPIGEVDWQGDPVGPPGDPYDIPGCIIWPVTRPDSGETIPKVRDVYVPPPFEFGPKDHVFARGETWSVDGDTDGRFISKSGTDKGVIVRIKKVA